MTAQAPEPAGDPASPNVLIRRMGRVGHIILNRPKALNALTHPMVRAITTALDTWAVDPVVQTVLLTGSGDRGLCAGGDIVAIYHETVNGGTGTEQFWAAEYAVNARIKRYPKPYLAVMDGLVLGGGVGLSAHASVRVVTDRTRLGLPETGIGFIPDVGGTYLLSRAPGELGTHLALTGGTVGGADAIALGMADHFVPADRLSALIESLAGLDAIEAVRSVAISVPPSQLAESRFWIDHCYASDSILTIVDRLAHSPVVAARAAATAILEKSPIAVTVTLAALRRARTLDSLEAVLDQEYRVSLHALGSSDLREGIRAQVIDKDRTPAWSPATLDAVSLKSVRDYFSPLGSRDLGLAPHHARPHERVPTAEPERIS
jgi:enoyl-CoA hydratase